MLLGLVLLVQGVAVSAAPVFGPDLATMTMDSDIPCHGQMDDQAVSQAVSNPASCCDADCPDMTSCMLGHLAIAAHFQLTTLHSPDAVPHMIPARIITHSPPSLLRPPITLHG